MENSSNTPIIDKKTENSEKPKKEGKSSGGSKPEKIKQSLPQRDIVHNGNYLIKNVYNMGLYWLDKYGYKSANVEGEEDSLIQTGDCFYFEKTNANASKEIQFWIKGVKKRKYHKANAKFFIDLKFIIVNQVEGQITIKGQPKTVNKGDLRIVIKPTLDFGELKTEPISLFSKLFKDQKEKVIESYEDQLNVFKEEIQNLVDFVKQTLNLDHKETSDALFFKQYDSV